jgi:MFS family permease
MTGTARDRVRLAAVVCTVLLAQTLLYPGVPDLVDALGATTDLDASMWFLVAEFAAFVAFVSVWGAASDAAGKRVPFILVGAVGGSVGYAALAVAPAVADLPFEAILAVRALQGAMTIGAFSLAMTMLMDLSGGHGKNMGAAGIAIGLGTAVGAPLGGQLTEIDPIGPLYVACALLLVAGLLVSRVADRAPSTREESLLAVLSNLTATPALTVPYAFGFIDRLTAGFFALVGTLYFRTAFDLGAGDTGLMLALFFAPFALLQYPFGALSDRVGRRLPILGGSAMYGLAVVAVGRAPTVELAGAGMVLVGVLGALMAPATMALVTDLAPAGDRGAAMAGFNLFGSLGFLAGFLVGGTVADAYGFATAFLVAGSVEVLLAVVTLPLLLRLDVDQSETFGGTGEA